MFTELVVSSSTHSGGFNSYNFDTQNFKNQVTMIDHTQMFVPAADHKAVVAFYEAALKPLGYKNLMAFGPNGEAVGFGDNEFEHQ